MAPAPQVRVAVGSDQSLIAEAVATALRNLSYDAVVVRWPDVSEVPGASEESSPPPPQRRPRRSSRRVPDVGLLLSDLSRVDQVHGAQALVSALPLPWLVMAGPRGPAWGGLYESGAALVVPSSIGLATARGLLDDLAAGRRLSARRQRRELIPSWQALNARRDELTARLGSLTDREEEVLRHLHDGKPVREIAESSAVTEATVRSQVKAILRKLKVSSQLAAVVAYEDRLNDSTADEQEPGDEESDWEVDLAQERESDEAAARSVLAEPVAGRTLAPDVVRA